MEALGSSSDGQTEVENSHEPSRGSAAEGAGASPEHTGPPTSDRNADDQGASAVDGQSHSRTHHDVSDAPAWVAGPSGIFGQPSLGTAQSLIGLVLVNTVTADAADADNISRNCTVDRAKWSSSHFEVALPGRQVEPHLCPPLCSSYLHALWRIARTPCA